MTKLFGGGGAKVDEAAARRTKQLQEAQMEEAKEKESEIAEAEAKRKRKSKGRASLLTGSAAGVQDTLG